MTRFSNVLHFDVARFDIIQHWAWAFVTPTESRAHERLSSCEMRL